MIPLLERDICPPQHNLFFDHFFKMVLNCLNTFEINVDSEALQINHVNSL